MKETNLKIITKIEIAAAFILMIISSMVVKPDVKDIFKGMALGMLAAVVIQAIVFRLFPGLYADKKEVDN